jgi:MerR family copper efflux transcriptional regulator
MIRHYESIGLIPAPLRRHNDYRDYAADDVHRLGFVRRARDLGFSVAEIRDLLHLWQDRDRSSADVKKLTENHISELDRKIELMRAMRDALVTLSEACGGDDRPHCPIINGLAGGAAKSVNLHLWTVIDFSRQRRHAHYPAAMIDPGILLRIDSFPTDKDLGALMRAAWPAGSSGRYQKTLRACLVHLTAHDGDRLVGFVKIATDGGIHAFLLDPTVHPDYRRAGLGTRLVIKAIAAARARGAEWLHVDFDPDLDPFYKACGFDKTMAGILRL